MVLPTGPRSSSLVPIRPRPDPSGLPGGCLQSHVNLFPLPSLFPDCRRCPWVARGTSSSPLSTRPLSVPLFSESREPETPCGHVPSFPKVSSGYPEWVLKGQKSSVLFRCLSCSGVPCVVLLPSPSWTHPPPGPVPSLTPHTELTVDARTRRDPGLSHRSVFRRGQAVRGES